MSARPPSDDPRLPELIRRYGRQGPRYTSYPAAPYFTDQFTEADYRARLAATAERASEPLALYVHLPFCQERCHFCGCSVVIDRHQRLAGGYLDWLEREALIVARALDRRRGLVQLHWGGGTPTHLKPDEIDRLWRLLTTHFEVLPGAEVAIEVDPRVTDFEKIQQLRSLGFNRISLGVQDLDPDVQAAIGRNQSEEQTRSLFECCRAAGFTSINVDLIYGLPGQTPSLFERTVRQVAELRPERLAVYQYAHVPWLRPQQKRIDVEALPSPDAKLALFQIAEDTFCEAGYRAIGMDHFALKEDELSRAQQAGHLHRNFMGYTVRPARDLIGLGMTAIGDVGGAFVQNVKKLSAYERALSEDRLPVERGLLLSVDDHRRRFVIQEILCNGRVLDADLGRAHGTTLAAEFSRELESLQPLEADGLIRIDDEGLHATELGRHFLRNVAMAFDRYLDRAASGGPRFSRTH